MAILIDRSTRVLVTGLTGRIGSFHAQDMIAHGTNVVGGVTPGRGCQSSTPSRGPWPKPAPSW